VEYSEFNCGDGSEPSEKNLTKVVTENEAIRLGTIIIKKATSLK
jgi:hypothetical protein